MISLSALNCILLGTAFGIVLVLSWGVLWDREEKQSTYSGFGLFTVLLLVALAFAFADRMVLLFIPGLVISKVLTLFMYVSSLLMAYGFLQYAIHALCDDLKLSIVLNNIGLVLLGLVYFALVIGSVFGFFYSYDSAGLYQRGSYFWLIFIYPAFTLAIVTVLSIATQRSLRLQIAFLSGLPLILIGLLLQFLSEELFYGLFLSVVLFLILYANAYVPQLCVPEPKVPRDDGLIPLSEELSRVEKFLTAENLRFNNAVKTIWNVTLSDFRVPEDLVLVPVAHLIDEAVSCGRNSLVLALDAVEQNGSKIIRIMDDNTGCSLDCEQVEQYHYQEIFPVVEKTRRDINGEFYVTYDPQRGSTITVVVP